MAVILFNIFAIQSDFLIIILNSMKTSRPFTAFKENRSSNGDCRSLLQSKRPMTAKNDSIKKIIQVIQSTLSRGAHVLKKKEKTMERFSKLKDKSINFTNKNRLHKQTQKYHRQVPQFQTQFFISNTCQVHRSAPYIKSNKKIFTSFDSYEFVPYLKQTAEAEEVAKRQRAPLKKVKRNGAKLKQSQSAMIGRVNFNEIDKWESQPSIFNMSYLLDK